MIGLVINIVRFIISQILKVYQPAWLLRFDKWCERKLGIDLIKQEFKIRNMDSWLTDVKNKFIESSNKFFKFL